MSNPPSAAIINVTLKRKEREGREKSEREGFVKDVRMVFRRKTRKDYGGIIISCGGGGGNDDDDLYMNLYTGKNIF
ncbi:hypothetical protein Phum_PHUM266330 [Pediculus humanus corporis]|uniref:Uncharacterized protein n=1 Tax=Pediculus humanus subsp. corporis TaxID=121224 RepID=E0VKK5_PEDHC|nr:uncharacterized protein Phum_PHUM266330 [Pediculus humanus corporis]EEB13911.1 hypothetical protein Phum_PHUM266330 [Pediculus humanus corporis]